MKMHSLALALVLSALAFTGACGGNTAPSELADPVVAPHPTNAAGDAYPTQNIGPNAGQTLANFAFQGYPSSDESAGLVNVSMADFFDPKGADHAILFVTIGANWCSACAEQTSTLKAVAAEYRAKGVIVMEVMVAGETSGYGPSQGDLTNWISNHATTWTVAADVRGRRMFGQLGFVGVPSSMLVDTRTMEIIHQAAGAPDDLGAYLQLGVDWVAKHPL